MKATIIVLSLIGIFILLFCITKVIVMKKSIIYKYEKANQKISNWDYYNKYDGNWFFKEIDYIKLYATTKDDAILMKKKLIKIYTIISASLFFTLIVVMVIGKISGLFN